MLKPGPTLRRNLIILLLGAAGFGSWWLLDEQREAVESTAERSPTPDSYFSGMELTRFDENGKASITIHARNAVHYPDAIIIELEDLRAMREQNGGQWTLTADRGELSTESNLLETERNVLLVQQAANGRPLELRTDRLTMDADRERVETPAAVTIRQGASHFSGTGLWASLAEGHIIIESDVKARYEE